MSAAIDHLLAELRRHHVRVERHGDRLKMKAPSPPPDELLAQVRAWKPDLLRALPDADSRPVLHFRLKDYSANTWATALGWPGETLGSLAADLRQRFGDALELRPRVALSPPE